MTSLVGIKTPLSMSSSRAGLLCGASGSPDRQCPLGAVRLRGPLRAPEGRPRWCAVSTRVAPRLRLGCRESKQFDLPPRVVGEFSYGCAGGGVAVDTVLVGPADTYAR